MELFNAGEIQDFIRCVNCMSKEDFDEMYRNCMFNPVQNYIDEKFNLCRNNFLNWICNIDKNTLEEMMKFCLDK